MHRCSITLAAVLLAACQSAPSPPTSRPIASPPPTQAATLRPTEIPAAHGRIAFIRMTTGSAGEEGITVRSNIFLVDADGSNLGQLTDDTRWHLHMYWLNDGSRLVSAWERFGDDSHLFLTSMLPDGTDQRDLGAVEEYDEPSRSPSGRYIAFGGDGSKGTGIAVLDLATGERIQLTQDGAMQPLWSPDSTKIVGFVPSKQVAVYDVPTGTRTFEVRAGVQGVSGWTHDGQGVLYRVCGAHDDKVECMNAPITLAKLDGSAPARYTGLLPTVPDGLVSPDGKWIAKRDAGFTDILPPAEAGEIDVTAAVEGERLASWSPDSLWLATTLLEGQAQQGRIVLRSPYRTASDSIPVTDGPGDVAPAWQP
jgi:hypothetical protein